MRRHQQVKQLSGASLLARVLVSRSLEGLLKEISQEDGLEKTLWRTIRIAFRAQEGLSGLLRDLPLVASGIQIAAQVRVIVPTPRRGLGSMA